MKTLTLNFKKGIDDLISTSPYSGEWGCFCSQIEGYDQYNYDMNRRQYADEVEAKNRAYIAELKANGQYGEVYTVTINTVEYAGFEEKPVSFKDHGIFMPKGVYSNPDIKEFKLKYEK